MSANRNLSGTPWHVSGLRMSDGDSKRHRSRCAYFEKEGIRCTVRRTVCIGSAHCDLYREGTAKNKVISPAITKPQEQKRAIDKNSRTQTTRKELVIKPGEVVTHRTYGECKIISVNKNSVRVIDEDGIKRHFSIDAFLLNLKK